MIRAIIEHALVGGIFACTGAWVTNNFCEHGWHQFLLGGLLVLAEAAIIVPLIG